MQESPRKRWPFLLVGAISLVPAFFMVAAANLWPALCDAECDRYDPSQKAVAYVAIAAWFIALALAWLGRMRLAAMVGGVSLASLLAWGVLIGA